MKPSFKDRPYFEVAIIGEGIDPSSVPLEQLASMLTGVSKFLRSVAEAEDIELPQLFLQSVRKGSAKYQIRASDPAHDSPFERVAQSSYQAAQSRGMKAGTRVRSSLGRLHSADRPGALRIAAGNVGGKKRLRPIVMAKPVEAETELIRSATILHGRIVGMEEVRDRIDVKAKIQGGRKLTLRAAPGAQDQLSGLFLKSVKMRASVLRDRTGKPDDGSWELHSLSSWSPSDFLSAIDEARQALADEGITINASDWIARLGDDE